MKPRLALLVVVLAGAVRAQDGGVVNPLHGTWKLDLGASSDVAPALDHFDANFFIRSFAKSVTPTNVITFDADRFKLEVQAPMYSRVTTVVLDGRTVTADEMFGNPYTYTSTLDGGVVVSTGTVTVKGVKERLELRRQVAPSGQMVLETDVYPPKGDAVHVKRVFNRVK